MRSKIIFILFFNLVQLMAMCQHDFYLGVGIGLQRNKPEIGNENNRYKIPSFSPVYKASVTFDLTNHFYLSMPVYFYRQQLERHTLRYREGDNFLMGQRIEYADYSTEEINSKAMYNFIGFGLVPGFSIGKEVRFFVAAGHLLEYSRIQPVTSSTVMSYYDYTPTGELEYIHGTTTTTNKSERQKGGEDHWWLFQGGVHFNLDPHFSLQPSVCYRISAGMSSVQVPLNYTRTDIAASVMLLYRLGNKRRNVKG